MDAEALRSAVEHAGFAAAGVGFLAGLVFSFNPVALASIPVSLAYVTRGRDKNQALLFGAMFLLGLILTHVALGVIAGLGGKWAAAIIRVSGNTSHGGLGCLPSRDSVRRRGVSCLHTGLGRIARRHGGNGFGSSRRGSAPCIRSRPCCSDCPWCLRRELVRKPQQVRPVPPRIRGRWRPNADRHGPLYAQCRVALGTCLGDV